MPQNNITPTKSNYTILKENLSLAKEGFSLLEQKREVLVMNLSSLIGSIRSKRAELDNSLIDVFTNLKALRLELGQYSLNMIVQNTRQDYEADIAMHSVMGVVVPKLFFIDKDKEKKSPIPMGISGTTPAFDKMLLKIKSIRSLMSEVAYLESTAWKIVNEIKKTQRRINSLDNFVIPETATTMKFIKEILEEKDRETLFQVKRIKANKLKQALKKEKSNEL
ncbi:MAG: V-type ATP synthase subunit D [Brevinema sp.]